MGWTCVYCKRKLKKGEPFILNGLYPGTWDRASSRIWYTFADDLGDYGAVYHEECFYKELSNSKYQRYKRRN